MTQASDTLSRLLADRYSCRAFLNQSVPTETIEAIVDLARQVPSWCNAQPWQVVITRNPETDRFREALQAEVARASHSSDLPFPDAYEGVYLDRRRVCGFQLYDAVGVAKRDTEARRIQMLRNFQLFDAPHVAIVSAPRALGVYGAVDCGAFVTAFTLAAQAHGVATIPQAALASYSPFLHEWFEIPDDRAIVCGISFGYADVTHPANGFRTERAPVDDIVDWRG